ncbi:hypothetical protein DM01DRAFT_1318835 [Hesseltinella vesiculosa]|uniref:protein-serine/threonine phosphatase n=1 Tax=Hesseltinella vesiculosa TaxID=101127 RepID=A0A1X2GNX1_9FUNG|nr:hypothetical protein DM01DRAFT_1318835 [Hesseltinella vesiculosa]
MDLKSMLIGDTPLKSSYKAPTSTLTPKEKEAMDEKAVTFQLSGTLQHLLKESLNNPNSSKPVSTLTTFQTSYDPNGTGLSLVDQPADAASASWPRLGPKIVETPNAWSPKLSLKQVTKEQPTLLGRRSTAQQLNQPTNDELVQLVTHDIAYRGDEPQLLLGDRYDILGAFPRGFFVMMAKRNIQHNFVFQYPDHPWFEDLYGLRKSAYILCCSEDGVQWQLHLKPSRDKLWLFGYLIKQDDMTRIVKDSMDEILLQRKLPLVLDLDDTLVRLVGEGNERFVPEMELGKYGNRVAVLKDGRRVVLTDRVHEFLDWAQNFYDISVCSLGDQNYVDNVVNVLDPQRTRIRGILYSARSEHDYIKRSPEPGRPPKDLLALFSFCTQKDKSLGSAYTLPLILDDEMRMWPSEQHDNIVVVKNQANADHWNVLLFPVIQETLQHIHGEFFRQLDSWYNKQHEAEVNGLPFYREPPSAVGIYKTYLRHMLRDLITTRCQ